MLRHQHAAFANFLTGWARYAGPSHAAVTSRRRSRNPPRPVTVERGGEAGGGPGSPENAPVSPEGGLGRQESHRHGPTGLQPVSEGIVGKDCTYGRGPRGRVRGAAACRAHRPGAGASAVDAVLPEGFDLLEAVEAGPASSADRLEAGRRRIELPGVSGAEVERLSGACRPRKPSRWNG